MKLTAMDLFSGCGGLTSGLKSAGFAVVAAVEVDRKAQATYAANHPEVMLYGSDIKSLDPLAVASECGIGVGQLDLIAGCPPCQGFSRLRTRNRAVSVEDDRNNLVSEFLRFVSALLPKTVMMENVPSLMADDRFDSIMKSLEVLGYKCSATVVDASDYGVPQRRKRMIMLGSRVHSPVWVKPALKRKTVREAISSLEAPSRSKDRLHSLPERRSEAVKQLIALIPKNGGSRGDLPPDRQLACHRRSNGFKDVYGRMAWDDVSPTITSGCHNPSKGRFLHPSRNRTITLREAAILQGFPKRYKFDVSHGKEAIALMIGNALPPPLIKAHAASLKEGLIQA